LEEDDFSTSDDYEMDKFDRFRRHNEKEKTKRKRAKRDHPFPFYREG